MSPYTWSLGGQVHYPGVGGWGCCSIQPFTAMCILDIGTLGGRDVLDLFLCASGSVGGGLLLLPTLSHATRRLLICVSVHFHRFLFQVLCFFSFFVLFLQVQQSVIHRVFLFVSILLFYFSPFCSACQFYTVITDTTLKILFHYTSSSCRLLVGCVLHGLPVILCHIMQSPKRLLKYTSVNRNKQIQMCQIVVNSFIM